LLFLKLAEDSFTLISGSEVTKYIKKLRFSTRKKVMKDFAKKQTAEHVRLISDLGPRILTNCCFRSSQKTPSSFILILSFEALMKGVFPGTKLCKSAGYESKTLIYYHYYCYCSRLSTSYSVILYVMYYAW
jgi:hypothetical protein